MGKKANRIRGVILSTVLFLTAVTSFGSGASSEECERLLYPKTRTVKTQTNYHGLKVKDPYRWLEQMHREEVKTWVDKQNQLTDEVLGLDHDEPLHKEIRERLNALVDVSGKGKPRKAGEGYFFSKRGKDFNDQSALYFSKQKNGKGTVVFDTNSLPGNSDGTTGLVNFYPSADGKYVACMIRRAGSDWNEAVVVDRKTGEILDRVDEIKFSGFNWYSPKKGELGFVYSGFPQTRHKYKDPNFNHRVYYHELGTKRSSDVLVYEDSDPNAYVSAFVTYDKKFLVLNVSAGTSGGTRLLVKDLRGGAALDSAPLIRVVDGLSGSFAVEQTDGNIVTVMTNYNAPNQRVVEIDIDHPQPNLWREIVREERDMRMEDIQFIGNRIVAKYIKDGANVLRILYPGKRGHVTVELPGLGSVSDITASKDGKRFDYTFANYVQKPLKFTVDLESGEATVKKGKANLEDGFVMKRVFVDSKDGTKVPMFVAHKKGLKLDGTNPAYVYAYGGFDISMTPYHSNAFKVWMEKGGVLAVPMLRGGGEYGENWHASGNGRFKQNVFDDFIASSEWLIGNGYTAKKKIGAGGGSNGGLLAGAMVVQRPDLFGAAVVEVGVLDMLRYHLFTVGHGWLDEYGNPERPEDFETLFKYSPLHNIKNGEEYPPTLITTGDHDDRVVPLHSYKFAAALQKAQKRGSPNPILLRTTRGTGHGVGQPKRIIIEKSVDELVFLLKYLSK